MKKQKSIGNKGFSLVELIIVIAIMAILIGVMAPQLLRYVERTRVSSDTQLADTVRTAIMTAMMDPAVDNTTIPAAGTYNITSITAGADDAFGTLVVDILGDTTANVAAKLQSRAYHGQPINYQITDTSQVIITITSADTTSAGNLRIPEATTP